MKVIYIGPTILSRGLQRWTVFGDLPSEFKDEPKITRLFVPVENLSQARKALDVEGSPEWSAFRSAVAAFLSQK